MINIDEYDNDEPMFHKFYGRKSTTPGGAKRTKHDDINQKRRERESEKASMSDSDKEFSVITYKKGQ